MSTPFWKPVRPGLDEWWARCDSCRWSGPLERFTQWRCKDELILICQHYWCKQNAELVQFLRDSHWEEVK